MFEVELHPHEELAALGVGRVLVGGDDVRAGIGEEARDGGDDAVPVGAGDEQPAVHVSSEATSASACSVGSTSGWRPPGGDQRVEVALRPAALDRPQLDAAELVREQLRHQRDGEALRRRAPGWPSRRARASAAAARSRRPGRRGRSRRRCSARPTARRPAPRAAPRRARRAGARARGRRGTARGRGRWRTVPSCSRRGCAASWKPTARCSSPRRTRSASSGVQPSSTSTCDGRGRRVAHRPSAPARPARSGTRPRAAARRRSARPAASARASRRSASASACSSRIVPAGVSFSPPGLAVQQPRPDLLLERRDLLRDGRLRQRERPRGGAERALVGHRPERQQPSRVHRLSL